MGTEPGEVHLCLQILAATPQRLAAASRGLDEDQLHSRPDADTWSANDILAHLRACVDVWGKTIRAMLAEDSPKLAHLSPRTWIRKTKYPQLGFQDSLQTFSEQREDLLKMLRDLPIDDWSRGADIGGKRFTVYSQASRMAQHESVHCEQLEALLTAHSRSANLNSQQNSGLETAAPVEKP